MPDQQSMAARAWADFDRIVTESAAGSPWNMGASIPGYSPDFDLLQKLLAVPIRLGAATQSGLPAKAVDVWLAHELRRAGFGLDEVWPRPAEPRVLPREVALLRKALPVGLSDAVFERIEGSLRGGVVSADANILGKAYVKQVDVVVSQWARGPEILISTKRMDSSFGKNAFNRIEESYGDAKNLRGRHPLAALGFVFVMRSTAFELERDSTLRLIDLIGKLAKEDDGYDTTSVVVAEWSDADVKESEGMVTLRHDLVPASLQVGNFLGAIVDCVLDRTPVDHHVQARRIRGQQTPGDEVPSHHSDAPPA